MIIYEYKDKDGDALTVSNNCPSGHISIRVTQDGDGMSAYIANADVPTVATELLKAAGQDSVIVPRATGDIVEATPGEYECGDGPERAYGSVSQNPNWLYNKAANCIAIAEYIEFTAAREAAKKAEAEATEKKLQDRRDAVLKEMGHTYTHDQLSPYSPMRKAVDRIIELEDGASHD